jgi:hypothetical protein
LPYVKERDISLDKTMKVSKSTASFTKSERLAILYAIDDFLEQGKLILDESTHFAKFCVDAAKYLMMTLHKLKKISKATERSS